MPVIGISVKRLAALLREDVDDARLESLLNQIGCDVEGVAEVTRYKSRHSEKVIEVLPSEALPLADEHSGVSVEDASELWERIGSEQVVRLDLLPVRPDIFDAGGLARALRGYLGSETGLKDYAAAKPQWRVEVDPRITDPQFGRPLIQCAVIRGISIDEEMLRAIMKLQENLHWALCRDRKFASIGAYDLAKLANPVKYTLVDRDSFRFTPLFWGGRGPVSPAAMLAEHPKGVDYAHLVEGMDELPALIAANGNVLSLPPVINAEETKVTTGTTDLLLDVTGHNVQVVTKALAILATSIVELDPSGKAQLERVEMVFPGGSVETPALEVEEYALRPAEARRLLGLELSRADCIALLEKMRHGVEDPAASSVPPALDGVGAAAVAPPLPEDEPLAVSVAAYRNDIMHEVDLIEDIAIAYGYHNIQPTLVPSFTAGQSIPLNDRSRTAAQALIGLGFIEALSLVLTSERGHYEKLLREVPRRRAEVANPASADQTMLREHLYSSLLELLALNTDHPLPQKVFEVGDCVTFAGVPDSAERPREVRRIAAAICATRTGYAQGRSVLDSLLAELKLDDGEYRRAENPSALPGRAAEVVRAGRVIAEVFELHPEALELWRIGNPVVLLSLTLGDVEYH